MNKRQAKREAHRLVALMIAQAQTSAYSSWSDDPRENELIGEAMDSLRLAHYHAGRRHISE